jgi:radical SAM protein with 4Fe4S-binding SPASM domain
MGDYEDVIYWMNVVRRKHPFKTINALPTITKYSLPYAREVVNAYVENGLDRIRTRHLIDSGFAHERWEKIGYEADEFLKFWKDVVEYCMELYRRGIDIAEGMSILIARKFLSKDYQAYTCWGTPCGAVIGQCAYKYNGDIYICDESRSYELFKLGNVKENSYREVLTSEQALSIIDLSSWLSTHCDNCVWQPYCGNCLVTTYGEQNNLIPKLPLNRECKIRGGMIEHVLTKLLLDKEKRKILLRWSSAKKDV